MYLIDIFDRNAKPFIVNVEEYENLIKNGYAKIVEEPFLKQPNLTSKSEELWKQRVKILNMLLEEIETPAIFDISQIWKTLTNLESSLECSANYMKKILRLYWQNGLNEYALIPTLGRTKILDVNKQVLRMPENKKDQGSKWKEIILFSFEKYYKKNPKATLESAYKEMLEIHFTQKIKVEGVSRFKLDEEYPSYWQFEYHTRHLRYTEDTLRKRWGSKNFDLKGRMILGVTQEKVFGPGSVFQIDATIADVYIVSSINREDIIGRPVLYFVTDSFSRLITGLYCGLEGPSWIGAMMALVNSASDKVAFCKAYGIKITEDEWPCAHIPEAIRGDRGELISKNAEEMVRLQGIDIENTPPFRAELKGVVERKFGIIQGNIKPFIPGYVDKDFRERGAKDYRLEAALTLQDFTKTIILEVLQHNKQLIKGYRKTKDLLKDKVIARPIDLWNWGVQKQSGILRKITVKEMKLTLMPSYEATVTPQGLKFRGAFYTSSKAMREEWFSRARVRGNWKIKIRVDERNCNYIYYWDELTDDLDNFQLVPFDRERFTNLSFDEVATTIAFENYRNRNAKKAQLEDEINKNARVREITNQAIKETEQSITGISNKKRTEGIRDNRSMEKEEMRKVESFTFGEEVPTSINFDKQKNVKPNSSISEDKQDLFGILDAIEKESGW
ncbi:DDE-type integrase/transposase/recombinase [Bacillus sp. REN16]|uniref:DDE-type integrase/transposase/recombinase n=1 Tax=Bacillus sp. REN16 TaxID=2887296 RepID=UPI001E58DDB4|nr:DDE-type integrase/transposase/recombinase [Bacillus sp. REN16]MCC3359378.1 DDE-type integrase/transposase/recombinase [Bacillus sp. REN16]